MNKVFISGNLTRDPEIRYSQSGKAIARMGIAINRVYRAKNSDTNQQTVDFFNLTAWEKTAEFCGRYLTKGSRVLVEGRLQSYSYEGKDGGKRSGVDIVVENIEFADNKRTDGNSAGRSEYKNNSRNDSDDFDDHLSGEDVPDEDVPFI